MCFQNGAVKWYLTKILCNFVAFVLNLEQNLRLFCGEKLWYAINNLLQFTATASFDVQGGGESVNLMIYIIFGLFSSL